MSRKKKTPPSKRHLKSVSDNSSEEGGSVDESAGENESELHPNDAELAAAAQAEAGAASLEEGPICEQSVKEMREIEVETKIASEKEWHRLGRDFLEVTSPLMSEEIIEEARTQSLALNQIEALQLEKKAFDSEIKGRIESLQASAIASAKRIMHGNHVEDKYFPIFFDPKTRERVYFDPEKDEEVKRMPAKQEDVQLKLVADFHHDKKSKAKATEAEKESEASTDQEDCDGCESSPSTVPCDIESSGDEDGPFAPTDI